MSELDNFIDFWKQVEKILDLESQYNVKVKLTNGEQITVPVLLKNFGGPQGMMVFLNLETITNSTDSILNSGFGYSCLGPINKVHDFSDETIGWIKDMLADWSWNGLEDLRPDWLPKHIRIEELDGKDLAIHIIDRSKDEEEHGVFLRKGIYNPKDNSLQVETEFGNLITLNNKWHERIHPIVLRDVEELYEGADYLLILNVGQGADFEDRAEFEQLGFSWPND